MANDTLTSGQSVAILSTNGTGRVTGHGVIVSMTPGRIAIVERTNGRRVAINEALLRVTQ